MAGRPAGCGDEMKVILFANTDWYLYNFVRSLAVALRDGGYELLLLSPPGEYGERLRGLGLRWEPVAMERRSLDPLKELRLIWRLARIFRRERPTLVHGFTIKGVVYGSLAARLARVHARVSAVSGMGYVFVSNALLARALRPVVRTLLRAALNGKAARLIVQNPDDAALFEAERLVEADRVRLIPGSGVDCERFRPADRPILSGPTTRVLLAARLLWVKGVGEYVAAARRLRAEGLPIRLLLAGAPDPGSPASIPPEQLKDWASEGVVELLGQVADMPALLAETDIAVLPSYREGLPRGLIEAAACGLPLVATDVPGCRGVVTHGKEGLLVPVRDAEALAAAIRRLHESPDLARRLGQAARARALAEFDERIVVEKILAVYRELGAVRVLGEAARLV